MRVLLVGPDYEENLSIRYLSASLLEAGHEPVLATFNSSADIESVANQSQDAAIVGLSMCFQSRAREFLHLAQSIKARDPNRLVVGGGHYASCAAEPLLANHPELDVIVIHEGEKTLVAIANAISDLQARLPGISGIAYRDGRQVRFTPPRPTLDDLDTLPLPDRRGPTYSIAGVPTSYLMGSRGCYGTCAYCCITTLHRMAPGKRFRQRNVERIADEMSVLYHERGTRQFVFHDDNFLVPSEAANHARISGFESALKSRGVENIALVIKCRPADANLRVLRRLKDLGLVRVFLGVESATADGLSSLERIQSVEDSVQALETCASLDISAQFTLMIFNADATLDTLRSDVTFMRRFSGNPLNFCRAEIYAGTPLEQRMIALGRARGDYLAREYSLSDPVADLACNLSLDLFGSRCWSGGSLMQNAIGLDHMAAVAKRFQRGATREALCHRVDSWLQSVNHDTINLLDEVIELSASAGGVMNSGLQRALSALQGRESAARSTLLSEGENLRTELETLPFREGVGTFRTHPVPRARFARQAAMAVLAIGMPALSACQSGVSEMAPPPLKDSQTTPPKSGAGQENLCSLTGTVTDPSGAVIENAAITIGNTDTGQTRTLTTNNAGQYTANDLPSGRYMVTAVKQGFRSVAKEGIMLKAGDHERADIRLDIGNIGCCEYAAGPLQVPDYVSQKKPFTYIVGDADDHSTLKGVAKVVYDDPGAWLVIFDANRDVVRHPESVPAGTSLLIPKNKRVVPKLIYKVKPVYPRGAWEAHIYGDILLDVTLKEDGSVDQVSLIDGPTQLAEAAITAVKQWRYHPLLVEGKPIVKFVVVVSFGKGGRIR